MTESNSKNRLQEYCQQNRLPLPKYESTPFDDGHTATCSIIIDDNTISGSGYANKVKEAEKMAAYVIMSKIESELQKRMRYISRADIVGIGGYIVVYLDIENINVKELRELFKYNRYNSDHILFVGCLSTGHHHATTVFEFEGISFQKVLVPSTRSDAADIGMIMHAMSNHTYGANGANRVNGANGAACEIIFVSMDRFSSVFVELASKGFSFDVSKTNIYQASNLVEMHEMLAKTHKGC